MSFATPYPRTFPLAPDLPSWAMPREVRRELGRLVERWLTGKRVIAKAAIAENPLTSGNNAVGGASAATASVTPGSNTLVLLTISNGSTSSNADPTSVTSTGYTWVKVDSSGSYLNGTGSATWNTTVWRTMAASSTAGAVTMNFSPNSDHITWSMVEFSNVDTSGTNGSGAVVQSANNKSNSATTLSVTLAAFGDATNNVAFGGFGINGGTIASSLTVGSGFTGIHQQNGTSFYYAETVTEWKTGQDTSVDYSWTGSDGAGGVAIEVKSNIVGSTTKPASLVNGGLVSRGLVNAGLVN